MSEAIETTGKVIEESVEKTIDEVKDKVIESMGIEAKEVQPIIEEVADIVTTVVSNEANNIIEALGLKMISESSLTEEQKKLASEIYTTAKSLIQCFIYDNSLNNSVKITKTIGQVIRLMENMKNNGKPISGTDKKMIAIHLGRILIKEVTPDDKGEAEIIVLYDLVAEPTLEAMIEVSKVVNTAINQIATTCCPGLLARFKKTK
jgi:hypothetical protein